MKNITMLMIFKNFSLFIFRFSIHGMKVKHKILLSWINDVIVYSFLKLICHISYIISCCVCVCVVTAWQRSYHIYHQIRINNFSFRFVSLSPIKTYRTKKMLLSAIIITSYHVIHWLLDVRNLFKFKKNDDDQLSINNNNKKNIWKWFESFFCCCRTCCHLSTGIVTKSNFCFFFWFFWFLEYSTILDQFISKIWYTFIN